MKKTRRRDPVHKSSPPKRPLPAGIRHFNVPIHEQDKDWLIENFKPGRYKPKDLVELLESRKNPVNVALLVRDLVWQLRERVEAAGGPIRAPFHELIRTFWYMFVKPTLAHADSLADGPTQYKTLSKEIADMARALTRIDPPLLTRTDPPADVLGFPARRLGWNCGADSPVGADVVVGHV